MSQGTERTDRRSRCPVVFALDLFGDRWTLLVVRDMVLRGFSTYGEFMDAGEGISTNILADRLKKLERGGIVVKRDDPDHGSRFRYRLTRKGRELIPVLLAMIRWSARNDPATPIPRALRRRLEREGERVASELEGKVRRGEPGFDLLKPRG